MEILSGKYSAVFDGLMLHARLAGYQEILVDLGAGDGRYVRTVARASPTWFAIGVDASREPLQAVSRMAPPNALYVIANALALPIELTGLASRITIICPWGSLLTALLEGQPALLDGLRAISRPGATLEVVLNETAVERADRTLTTGGRQLAQALRDGGFRAGAGEPLDAAGLAAWPTSWARRLAAGRRQGALVVRATTPALDDMAARPPPPGSTYWPPVMARRHPARLTRSAQSSAATTRLSRLGTRR